MMDRSPENTQSPRRPNVSAYDIPTRDKIPVIQAVMAPSGEGLALDIGIGTGYTTDQVFGNRTTVCVDLHMPNLVSYRRRAAVVDGTAHRFCVVARASQLPFKCDTFRFALCSEVLEHLEDDDEAVAELTRVLARRGRAVITVPYTGLGLTSFLELFKVKTVHDVPGPEFHVRPGYNERSMEALLHRHGLDIEQRAYYLRFFTRLMTDVVSIAHLVYQRVVRRRQAWNWADVTAEEHTVAFRLYTTCVFPVLWAVCLLDRLLGWTQGFGLVVAVRRRGEDAER